MSTSEKTSTPIDRWIQTSGVVIALLALAVTVYFSVKADKLKEVTVSYLSKQALVAIENAHAKSGLEVRLAGNNVGAPWLLSGRLENSGNTPVEERDIESPVRLTFEGGKLLSADIGSKKNPDIFSKVEIQGNSIVIQHKLLNPGDWIGFDLVFDGEPRIPGTLAVRISGVESAQQRINQPEKYQSHLSIVPVPRPAFIMGLALLSLLFALIALLGVMGLWDFFSCIAKQPRSSRISKKLSRISVPELLEGFVPNTRRSRLIWPFFQTPTTSEQIDDLGAIEATLERDIPVALREEIAGTISDVAAEYRLQLRKHLQETLAGRLFSALPNGLDSYHRDTFAKRDLSSLSSGQIIDLATQTASDPTANTPLRHRFDPQDPILGGACLILALSALMVLGGAWRTLLSN